jgi:hypothetical protein
MVFHGEGFFFFKVRAHATVAECAKDFAGGRPSAAAARVLNCMDKTQPLSHSNPASP